MKTKNSTRRHSGHRIPEFLSHARPMIGEFANWTRYFEHNAHRFDEVNWAECAMTRNECKAVSYSIRQFQHGEQSEGKNLRRFATQLGDPDYRAAIGLFIAEEQQHADGLGRFLDQNRIERLEGHWIDNIFRRIRKMAGLELAICTLLTAELVAAVYYKALMHATQSIALKQICRRILRDEEMHINFQSAALRTWYKRRPRWRTRLSRWLHRVFNACVAMVVAVQHRRALRAGGMGMAAFTLDVMERFDRADAMITGQSTIRIRPPQAMAAG
jgi:rubrerythrin